MVDHIKVGQDNESQGESTVTEGVTTKVKVRKDP